MTNMDSANANGTAWGFNFFSPRSLRLMGALGKTTPHAQKQHICKLANRAKTQVCKRAVFFPLAPVHICNLEHNSKDLNSMALQQYISNFYKHKKMDNATEHTFQGDLLHLNESIVPVILENYKTKRQVGGEPDFILTKNDISLCFIEGKDTAQLNLDSATETANASKFHFNLFRCLPYLNNHSENITSKKNSNKLLKNNNLTFNTLSQISN